ESMKRLNLFVAFAIGWTSAIVCVWIAGGIRVQAAADDAIHVCVGANGLMHVIATTANCPPGQQFLSLKKWAPDSVDVPDADKPSTPGSNIDPRRIADLERLVKELENAADRGSLSNRVVAPFEVVDRAGKRIFYVEADAVRLYNAAGADVAHMLATSGG